MLQVSPSVLRKDLRKLVEINFVRLLEGFLVFKIEKPQELMIHLH